MERRRDGYRAVRRGLATQPLLARCLAVSIRQGLRYIRAGRWARDFALVQKRSRARDGYPANGSSSRRLFGSLLLPVIALRWGYQAAFVTAGIICIIVTAVSVRGYRRPQEDVEPGRQRMRDIWQGMLRVSSRWSSICVNLMCTTLVAVQFTTLSFLALTAISVKHTPHSP